MPKDIEAIEGQNIAIDCSATGDSRVWWERAYEKSLSPPMHSKSTLSLMKNGGNHNISKQQQSPTMNHFRTVVSNSHIHTAENGSLIFRDIHYDDSGTYLCQANNGVGSGLSKVIKLKVHGKSFIVVNESCS